MWVNTVAGDNVNPTVTVNEMRMLVCPENNIGDGNANVHVHVHGHVSVTWNVRRINVIVNAFQGTS